VKVSNTILNILSPNQIREVRSGTSVLPNERTKQTERIDRAASAKEIKPIDILSSDEIEMLNRLFSAKDNYNVQTSFYLLNRTRAQIGKLGSFIDVKK